MRFLARAWYEVRWWRWYMFDGGWPIETLYMGPHRLDKESRRLIIERTTEAWKAREPMFRGGYPNSNKGVR